MTDRNVRLLVGAAAIGALLLAARRGHAVPGGQGGGADNPPSWQARLNTPEWIQTRYGTGGGSLATTPGTTRPGYSRSGLSRGVELYSRGPDAGYAQRQRYL